MSTANFNLRNNASCIFAEMKNEEINNTVENIQFALSSKGYDEENIENLIASKESYIDFCGARIQVGITCSIHYGYYEGASFDWALNLDGENLTYFPVLANEAAEMLYNYSCGNAGFCKMQGRNLAKKINRAARDLIKEVEIIYTQYTTPLRCIGVFGNGEAVYTENATFPTTAAAV